jgi:hypothetical protein
MLLIVKLLYVGEFRFIPRSTTIPARVLRHFPLIPRLKRMYRSPAISELLKWHQRNPSEPDLMRSVVDSPEWAHIDEKYPDFAAIPQNLRFGLSLDRVNPFKLSSTVHSTWPILMLIYNLPPWLVTKRFFVSLTLLISGKDSPTSDNIDLFMQPLLDELLELWEGVHAQDFAKPVGQRAFRLRGLLMWTISDYPAYGLILGLCTKGYKACCVCGPETVARFAKVGALNDDRTAKGSKVVYSGGRRWLRSRNHPYRKDLDINGQEEFRRAPKCMSTDQVLLHTEKQEHYLRSRGRLGVEGDPVHVGAVKPKNKLFDLPYWRVGEPAGITCKAGA